MKTYYYETHQSDFPHKVVAEDDNSALEQLRKIYGEQLQSVMIIYNIEEKKNGLRTVWEEK